MRHTSQTRWRPSSALAQGHRLFKEFHGALVESFVAQQLIGSGLSDLFYWRSPGGQAEVGTICEFEGALFPLEARDGATSKSLRAFGRQFAPSVLSCATLRNMNDEEGIRNYPLYAVSAFPRLSRVL